MSFQGGWEAFHPGFLIWIPAFAGMAGKKGMTGKKRRALVISAVPLVIPAEAGIQVTGVSGFLDFDPQPGLSSFRDGRQ